MKNSVECHTVCDVKNVTIFVGWSKKKIRAFSVRISQNVLSWHTFKNFEISCRVQTQKKILRRRLRT